MHPVTNDSAVVFDIERFAVEDGPGIRSVVFFKGCGMECLWCQNPESQDPEPQVMYAKNDCLACGRCVEVCPQEAIRDVPGFGFVTDHSACDRCGRCLDACYSGARTLVGRALDADSIMEELLKDRAYYEESGGGVTFSGGEPLLQPRIVEDLARRCRSLGIHTAVETAGFVAESVFDRILPHVDLVYFDLKHIDSRIHREKTGVPLEPILENLKKVSKEAEHLIVRIPFVPGVNDDRDTMRRMLRFLKDDCGSPAVEILPFHRLGLGKYEGLGRFYAMAETPNLGISDCEASAELGRDLGLTVRTGAGES